MQPYAVRDSMLDSVERSLYRALNLVICQRALLFTKINLSDLVATTGNGPRASELGQLANQRVDFVLCDRDSLRPLAIILLETDGLCVSYIEELCLNAGLPLRWMPRQNSYLMQQLTPVIEPLLIGGSVGNDFSNGDRKCEPVGKSIVHAIRRSPRHLRKTPAYPGYGALKTMAGKLS